MKQQALNNKIVGIEFKSQLLNAFDTSIDSILNTTGSVVSVVDEVASNT